MYYKKLFLNLLLITLLAVACVPGGQYAKVYYFSKKTWEYKDVKEFKFTIKDTSKNYNLIFLMQHTYAFPHSNIWINLSTKYPSGHSDTSHHLEIPLALLNGTWLGRSAGNISTQEMNIGPDCRALHFAEKGEYTMTMQQDTRLNPLPEINYVGLKIEAIQN
jgi:gliding motility-associated lipoprotein GldH